MVLQIEVVCLKNAKDTIINLQSWNKAAICKLLWDLCNELCYKLWDFVHNNILSEGIFGRCTVRIHPACGGDP